MWVQLFLWIATTLLTDYFREPLPEVTASGLGDFKIPTATEGRFVPLAFGTNVIQGPNVTWYGDFVALERTVTTGLIFKRDEGIGFTYFLGMQLGLIRGESAGIKRIWVGDDVVWDYLIDNGGVISKICDIDRDDLFGGKDSGGGFQGRVRLYDGSPTQAQSDYLKYQRRKITDSVLVSPQFETTERFQNLPNFRGFSYVTIANIEYTKRSGPFGISVITTPAETEGADIGESNQMRHMKFEIQTFDTVANGGLGDDLGLGNDHHFIGEDLNPISLAYDVFTNRDWGRGFSPSDINITSFKEAAEIIYDEGLGFSLVIDQVQKASDLIDTIEQHIDGYIGPNPLTGLMEVILARQDYVKANEFQANGTNLKTISKYSRGEYNQTFNEVRVQYTDRDKDYKDNYAPAQDLANLIIQGRPRSKTMRYSGVHTAATANKIVWRQIRGLAVALATATIEMDRTAWNLQPGKVIVVTDEEVGISDVAFRIIQIRHGDPENASILLDVVEDVFGNEPIAFTDPPPSEFIPPSAQSFALLEAQQMAMEAPYIITRNDTEFPDRYPRLYIGARTLDTVLNFEVNVDQSIAASPSGFGVYEPNLSGLSIITGSLRDTLTSWQDGNGTFTINVDPLNGNLESIVGEHAPGGIGSLTGVCVINPNATNEEWVITDNIDWIDDSPVSGAVQLQNVYRAGLDSAMQDHSPGEPIWFIWTGSAGMILDKQWGLSNTLDVKLLATTQTDRVNLTDSPVPPSALPVVIDADARYNKPLLPIELDFAGYGNFPDTSESPEDFIDFDAVQTPIDPDLTSPEVTQYQGAQVIPTHRYFRTENVVWSVQGLDDAGTAFNDEVAQDKLRISWWIYDLDATPSATRGADEFDSAIDVPLLTANDEIRLLKSMVPTTGRLTNTFTARLEIETSHSPQDVFPTSPEAYSTSREVMYFDFEVTALFIVPPEAVFLHTRFDGDVGSKELKDLSINDLQFRANGDPSISSTASVFGGKSGYFAADLAGGVNMNASGWHAPVDHMSPLPDFNQDFTIEFRMRLDAGTVGDDRTIIGQYNVSGELSWYLFYDINPGTFEIVYSTNGSGVLSFVINQSANWIPSPILDQWYAIAVVKKWTGSTWLWSLLVDGVLIGTGTNSATWYASSDLVQIGANRPNTTTVVPTLTPEGYIDELRMTLGYAIYAVDYTVASEMLPSYWDKVVVLASFEPDVDQNSTFGGGLKDESVYGLNWELGGTSDIAPYNPFNASPDGEGPYWSMECFGVDHTTEDTVDGAYLTEMQSGTRTQWDWTNRDFTMEAWMMERTAADADGTAICSRYNRPSTAIVWWWYISVNYQVSFGWSPTGSISSQKSYQSTGVPATSPIHDAIALNEWHHHAVERKDDDLYMWLDGTLIGYEKDHFLHVDATNGNELHLEVDSPFAVGRFFDVSVAARARALDGYITEPRVTLDEAIYADALTESPLPFFGSPPDFGPSSPKGPVRSPEFTYTVPTAPFPKKEWYAENATEGPDSSHLKFLCHWVGGPGSPLLGPVDESVDARAITMFGGATLDSLTPFPNHPLQTGSLRLGTDVDSPIPGATIPDDAAWDIDNDDFTLETIVMFNSIPTASPQQFAVFIAQWVQQSDDRVWRFGYHGATQSLMYSQTTSGGTSTKEDVSVPWVPVAGPSPEKWYHISVTRKNSIVYFHVDGVLQGLPQPFRMTTTPNVGRSVHFGMQFDLSSQPENVFDGWMAETRITIGHHVYEMQDFEPMTEPFMWHKTIFQPGPDRRIDHCSKMADYSFLAASVATGDNAWLFTTQGAYYSTPPSPDLDNYVQLTMDCQSSAATPQFTYIAAQALLDEEFTVEGWYSFRDNPITLQRGLIGHYENSGSDRSWGLRTGGDGYMHFLWSADGITPFTVQFNVPSPFTTNVWYHIAVVRDNSGSPDGLLRMFIDGVEMTEASAGLANVSGITLHDPTPNELVIGSYEPFVTGQDGLIEEARVLKGVCLYRADFTPPTKRFDRY